MEQFDEQKRKELAKRCETKMKAGQTPTDEERHAHMIQYAKETGEELIEVDMGIPGEPPMLATVDVFLDEFEKAIEYHSYNQLRNHAAPIINSAIRDYRNRYKRDNKDLQRVRKRVNRAIKKTEPTAGTTPAPSEYVRSSVVTEEYMDIWDYLHPDRDIVPAQKDKPSTFDNTPVDGAELAPSYEATIASREASLVVDAIGVYVAKYWADAESEHLTVDGETITLRDSFDGFCKKAGLEGRDRQDVKQALFPGKGIAGPLERVKFLVPHPTKEKTNLFFESNLVTRGRVVGEQHAEDPEGDGARIKDFELFINTGLYGFLFKRDKIRSGQGKGLTGRSFQYLPILLTHKIEQCLSLLSNYADYKPFYRSITYNRTGFAQATRYLINRWNTGQQRRTHDMVVSWKELNDRGYLSNHQKDRKERRKFDMQGLAEVCRTLLRDGEAFIGCGSIHYTQRNELVFSLQSSLEMHSTTGKRES